MITMRMRVEELALQADVSVDTIRFYQKQRLLPAPGRDGRLAWYNEDHLERIARIKELQRRGFTLAVIRRFLSGELDPADERLAAAVVEAGAEDTSAAGDGEGEAYDLEGLAAKVGVPSAILESLVREGLLVPRMHDGEARFGPDDVTVLSAGLRLLEAGLPLTEVFDLARRFHALSREVATQAVELFDVYVRKPLRAQDDLSDAAKAERMVETFRTLMPAVSDLVAFHFRRILLQVAQEHLEAVGDAAEIAAAAADDGWSSVTRRRSGLPQGDEKVRAVDDMFDAIAPRYDALNRILTMRMDVGWRKKTVRSLALPPGAIVLDLACGTGDLCRVLDDAGYRPVGVDRSAGMLAAARTSAPLVRGDALALSMADGSVDGIVCGFALRNVLGLDLFFAECARVLRPGGRVALLEVAVPANRVLRAGHGLYFGKVVPFVGGLLSDRAAYRYLPQSVAYLPPPPEMLTMMAAAGFTRASRRALSGGIAQLLTGTRASGVAV